MPAAVASRPSIPTVGTHRPACPADPARQEVYVADVHGRDGAITGQTGMAHCLDCGKVERTGVKQVQAYLARTVEEET